MSFYGQYDILDLYKRGIIAVIIDIMGLEVRTKNYTTSYQFVDHNLLYFQREHVRKNPVLETDVFSKMWSFAISPDTPNWLRARRNGISIPLDGSHGIFIPPFSIIEWDLNSGRVEWGAYLCVMPPPDNLPTEPFAFKWNPNNVLPKNISEIFTWIREAPHPIPIGKVESPTAVAFRLKAALDRTFSDDISLQALADELHYSHAVMTRYFVKCFGITPIAYRNKLRIYDSLRLMLFEGQSVSVTSHLVGFQDIGRFNKNFKQQNNAVPSQFCTNKRTTLSV